MVAGWARAIALHGARQINHHHTWAYHHPVTQTLAYAPKEVPLGDDAIGNRTSGINNGITAAYSLSTNSHRIAGSAKDIPHAQCAAQAKPIDYYLTRNKDRHTGIREAVTKGQHSMTGGGKALGLTVSRISRIVKAANENMARDKA